MTYHSLNTDPEAADRTDLILEKPAKTKRFWQKIKAEQDWSRLSRILLIAAVSLLAVWGAVDVSSRALTWALSVLGGDDGDHPPCWCGASDEEAVARGCIWDHIAVDWLPPHCVDRELMAEFDVAGSGPGGAWPYFVVPDQQQQQQQQEEEEEPKERISLLTETQGTPVNLAEIDQLAREGKEYWTTVEWHISHCLFTWRKQVRSAAADGRGAVAVEPWNDVEGHALHCSKYIWNVLRTGRPLDEVSTLILGKDRHVDE